MITADKVGVEEEDKNKDEEKEGDQHHRSAGFFNLRSLKFTVLFCIIWSSTAGILVVDR